MVTKDLMYSYHSQDTNKTPAFPAGKAQETKKDGKKAIMREKIRYENSTNHI